MDDLEKRVKELEGQVAGLLVFKQKLEREEISESLNSSLPVTDAFYVDDKNPLVTRGFYCRSCWEKRNKLAILNINFQDVPYGRDSRTRQCVCPECKTRLNLQFETM